MNIDAGIELLEAYGPTIASADQANWPRHRKVLATPFNESAMAFVWSESLRQAQGLVGYWTSGEVSKEGFASMAKNTRTLSLNVMAACGFRRSFDFKGEPELSAGGGTYSYCDALQIVLDNVIVLMLIPRQHLIYSWLPKKLKVLGKAADDFKMHMAHMLGEEKDLMERGEKGSGSLMTSLVRALDTRQTGDTGSKGLSVDDIFGIYSSSTSQDTIPRPTHLRTLCFYLRRTQRYRSRSEKNFVEQQKASKSRIGITTRSFHSSSAAVLF